MRLYVVYGLCDPDAPDVVRYVGATRKPLAVRLSQHCGSFKSKQRLSRRDEWIKGLAAKGKKPLIVQLEECDESSVAQLEGKWIGNFRIGSRTEPQLNSTLPAWKPGDYYLSQRLKNWRGEITQKEAAAIFDVSVNTYRNWEYGVNIPGVLAMKEIDRILKRPIAEYLKLTMRLLNETVKTLSTQ